MRKPKTTKPVEPPAELVEKALDKLFISDLADFADHLETARTVWRRYKDLVECPEFPEKLRAAFLQERGWEPSDDCVIFGEKALKPGHRESQRGLAVEIARAWALSEKSPEDPNA